MSDAAPLPAAPTADTVVGVVGLGYVGLPLAVTFGRHFETRAFDIDGKRIDALRSGQDGTGEVDAEELAEAAGLTLTDRLDDLKGCDVYVVAVPTPIDADKKPDLCALRQAASMVGRVVAPGGVVVFESTVYPGATEEECAPLIAAESGLRLNEGFYLGYSPERVNPGDRDHRLSDVVKVTAGSTPAAAAFVDALYRRIVPVGTHPAPDIRTAEAAKVIENVQRDLNIALVNELAMIFHRLNLDTEAVLQAAGSKWNFLPFRPGLVGGHCIGVDPYYLTAKAEDAGHSPDLILAGRRVNDDMAGYVAERVAGLLSETGIDAEGARVLVLGYAFKENCPDVRNTKVADLVRALHRQGAKVDVFDPLVAESGCLRLIAKPGNRAYDAVVLAVAHDVFRELGAERIRAFGKPRSVVFDVKHMLPAGAVDGRL